jgi:hypothetical protein
MEFPLSEIQPSAQNVGVINKKVEQIYLRKSSDFFCKGFCSLSESNIHNPMLLKTKHNKKGVYQSENISDTQNPTFSHC